MLTFVDGVLHMACSPATVHDLRHVVNRRRGCCPPQPLQFFHVQAGNRLVARQQAASWQSVFGSLCVCCLGLR
jgi:hypothetical protein